MHSLGSVLLTLFALGSGQSATAESPQAGTGIPPATIEAEPPPGATGGGSRTLSVLVVGDSLAVGTRPHLEGALPGWRVVTSAETGRHASEGVAEITSRGSLPPVIVVSLGTNDDPAAVSTFAGYVGAVLDAAGPAGCVVWPDIVRPPYNGVSYAGYNRALHRLAASNPNLLVVDWTAMVAAQPGLLASDGVHATPSGYVARAQAIAQAVEFCGGGIQPLGD